MGWGIGENSVLFGWLRFHVKHALPAQPNGRFEAGSNCILADHFCLGGAGDFTSTILYIYIYICLVLLGNHAYLMRTSVRMHG